MRDHAEKDTLQGEFVDLRPLRVGDAELTFRWRNSARASLLNRPPKSVQQQAAWIAGRPEGEYNFIIETKAHRPVGMVALTGIDHVARVGEPGRFLIGDEEAVRGIPAAVEAMKLVYELAFDRLQLRRVWGMIASDNVRMIRWQSYLGMTQEGRLREHLFIDGRWQDAILFGLLESDYRRLTVPRLKALIAAGRLPVGKSPDSRDHS